MRADRARLSAASSGAPEGRIHRGCAGEEDDDDPDARDPFERAARETPPRGGAARDATSARGGGRAATAATEAIIAPNPPGSPPTIGPVRPTTLRPRGVPFRRIVRPMNEFDRVTGGIIETGVLVGPHPQYSF